MSTHEELTATQEARLSEYERRNMAARNLVLGLAMAGEHHWATNWTGRWCQSELGLTDEDMRSAANTAMDDPRLAYTPLGFETVQDPSEMQDQLTPDENRAVNYVVAVKKGLEDLRFRTRPMARDVVHPPQIINEMPAS